MLDKPDPRIARTRDALVAAFNALVLTRGYATLTVGAIVEKAGVGRSTFYEHFSTKDDLLAQSLTVPFNRLAATADGTATPTDLIALLDHFRSQRGVARCLFAGTTRQVITRALARLIEDRLTAKGTLPAPGRIAAFQIAASHLALIEAWIWAAMPWSPRALADTLIATGTPR